MARGFREAVQMERLNESMAYRIIGIGGLSVSMILLIFFPEIIAFLTLFGENFLSPDHSLLPGTITRLRIVVIGTFLIIVASSTVLIFTPVDTIRNVLGKEFLRRYFRQLFYSEEICGKPSILRFAVVTGTITGLGLFCRSILYYLSILA